MSNSTYAIRGIPVAAGQPIPTRKEITAWSSIAENDLQVSLFIQALAVFQKLEVTDQLSYFRVAGLSYPTLVAQVQELSRQEYTVTHKHRGMELQILRDFIVITSSRHSRAGIDHTFYCSR